MEDKLLREINRFREISKLPLLTEQYVWLDNLISAGTKRLTGLDDIINRLGYKGKNLTDDQIDDIADQLKNAGATKGQIDDIKSILKSDANVRKALTTPSDDFVSALKNAAKRNKKTTGGFVIVKNLDPIQIKKITKDLVTKYLNDPTSDLLKYFNVLDNSISGGLQKIYDKGQTLYSVDEMYDVFDGFINKTLFEGGYSDDLAESILQSFKTKFRTSSKTKELLEKFKTEKRTLNRPSRVNPVSKYDKTNILSDEWLELSKWKAFDGKGNPIMYGEKKDFNLFKNLEYNTDFITAFRELKKHISEENPKVEYYVKALNKGTTIDTKPIFEDLKGLLGTQQIEQLRIRLENPSPIKKIGMVSDYFWTYIEPFISSYRELVKSSGRVDAILNKITKKPPTTMEDFLKTLESIQINFDDNLTEGQIKSLKDKFLRLKSEGTPDTYKKLYDDLDNFLQQKLDDVGKEEWLKIQDQLMAENPSNWKWLTWKEIVDDADLTKKIENKTLSGFKEIGLKTEVVPTVTNASYNGIRKKYGNIFSWLFTGSFTTPKSLMRELVKNGYAKKGRFGKLNISAGGKNFIKQLIIKRLITPLVVALVVWVFEGGINRGMSASDFQEGFFEKYFNYVLGDFVPKKISEEMKEASPEWYEFLNPYLDFTIESPAIKGLKYALEGQLLDFKTTEEKTHEELDEKITDLESKWKKDGDKLGKDKLERYKGDVKYNDLSNDVKNNVINNMSLDSRIDPKIKEAAHNTIKVAFQKNEDISGKLKDFEEGVDANNMIEASKAINNIIVTTQGKRYLLFEEPVGSGYIYFYKPTYDEILDNPNITKTKHNLNELVF
jgi:hypothetical protein